MTTTHIVGFVMRNGKVWSDIPIRETSTINVYLIMDRCYTKESTSVQRKNYGEEEP